MATITSLAGAFQATAGRDPHAVAVRSSDGATEITWARYADRVRRIATGLASLGVTRGDTVALMMANRPEFHLVDTAVFHLGATPFSIYNTLPPGEIAHLLANAGSRVVVADHAHLARVLGAGAREHVITVEGPAEGATLSLAELEEREGPVGFDFATTWQTVRPDDVLTLIYTSGTTGPPKGVEITHANMLAQCAAVTEVLPIGPKDSTTSYLPSAHIADRWSAHYNGIVYGVQVTDVADPRAIAGVLPALRPTIWGGVPRVMEKLKAGLETAIAADPDPGRRTAAQRAIALGVEKVRLEQAGATVPEELALRWEQAEAQVLTGLRARLGLDRVRWMCVGAAPLSRDVHEFLLALGLPVVEMYGMSEGSGMVTAVTPAAVRVGSVGPLIPGLEHRVADDGELLVRGPTVMRGYRGQPEATAEAVDADGWLHSGDVVAVDDDGYITVVDRKKELIINAAGKNMSPAKIEAHLKDASPLIGQAAVIGDRRPYNVALLVLDPEAARAAAPGDRPFVDLIADPGINRQVAEAVARANGHLARVEQIKRYELLPADWLPGGDELTPTMKLKRRQIAKKYGPVIDALYAAASA